LKADLLQIRRWSTTAGKNDGGYITVILQLEAGFSAAIG